jgi:hypothetical protein
MEEKNDRGEVLINVFREKAKTLNNEELIKGWEDIVIHSSYYSMSAKDNIAIDVFGEELISRKLKTLTELQEFYKFHSTEAKKEIDNE